MPWEIEANGGPVARSANESHFFEVAEDSRLTIADTVRAFLPVFETTRL
jgi:hypothetical protein